MSETTGKRAIYPSLEGKRVLVTGGGSGIGAGIVESFAAQGCDVSFFDINHEDSSALAKRTGGRFVHVDLMDTEASQRAIRRLEDEGGAIDVLINNAANDDRHSIDDITEDYWADRVGVNLKHQFFCAQAVIPGMRSKGGGVILNMGSISWHLGLPGLALYEMCKAAIEGLTRALARELGPDCIRVNCIVPGSVHTPRQMKWYTPEAEAEIVGAQCLKARLMPDDIAAMALFLAADDSKLITGHEYFVDAGWR